MINAIAVLERASSEDDISALDCHADFKAAGEGGNHECSSYLIPCNFLRLALLFLASSVLYVVGIAKLSQWALFSLLFYFCMWEVLTAWPVFSFIPSLSAFTSFSIGPSAPTLS